MKTATIPILLAAALTMAQPPDLDDLGEGLDMSILKTPTPETAQPVADVHPRHLFHAFDRLPVPGAEPEESEPSGLEIRALPRRTLLVAPNPARIDSAYHLLAEAVDSTGLPAGRPVKIVLHADGNVSVALTLPEGDRDAPPLPMGVDLSPQPPIRLAGVVTDIQIVDKTHPLMLNAFRDLRQRAAQEGLSLDRTEFFFLPERPGRVFFGLKIRDGSGTE